jgi:organic radical activating enzyme
MSHKVFPIKTATACQLKWTYSTVYLHSLTTASCCVGHTHQFDLESFNFHNTSEKIRDRGRMLNGEWPELGCEFCKRPESFGAPSDRTMFNDWPTYRAPPEFDTDLTATTVTPRILQIYFGNTCNLKCIYCNSGFSSQINQENQKFGAFSQAGVSIPGYSIIPETLSTATESMLEYIKQNIKQIDHIMIMGGEPFIQKETLALLDLLGTLDCSQLNLHITSNLMVAPDKFQRLLKKLESMQVQQIHLTASIDCWDKEAEYIRTGLQVSQFKENFEYALYNSNVNQIVHTTLSALNTKSLPELVKQINVWNQHKTIYWSVKPVGGKPFLHYKIFGNALLDLGLRSAIELFDTDNDPDKEGFKQSYLSIITELENSSPDIVEQAKLKVYLQELDRRRKTDFRIVFPEIASILDRN